MSLPNPMFDVPEPAPPVLDPPTSPGLFGWHPPATAPPPAIYTPPGRLQSMVLPNGEFVIVADGLRELFEDEREQLRGELQARTGAAAVLVFSDQVDTLDAAVPAGAQLTADELLIGDLRATESLRRDLAQAELDLETLATALSEVLAIARDDEAMEPCARIIEVLASVPEQRAAAESVVA